MEYLAKDKEVKRSCRTDKRHYIDALAMEAETAAENNDIRTLYKTAKKMRGGYGTSQDKPVKTVDGRLIKGESEKISRWKEHFETTLNRPAPLQTSDIPEREDDIDISTDPITVEEVKQAIKKLKCGKAPGEDGVCAEMLKAGGEVTARFLCHIRNKYQRIEKQGLLYHHRKKEILATAGNGGASRSFLFPAKSSVVFCLIGFLRL